MRHAVVQDERGPADGAVQLDLRDATGPLAERWLNIGASRWEAERIAAGGGTHRLAVPGSGQWVALLARG